MPKIDISETTHWIMPVPRHVQRCIVRFYFSRTNNRGQTRRRCLKTQYHNYYLYLFIIIYLYYIITIFIYIYSGLRYAFGQVKKSNLHCFYCIFCKAVDKVMKQRCLFLPKCMHVHAHVLRLGDVCAERFPSACACHEPGTACCACDSNGRNLVVYLTCAWLGERTGAAAANRTGDRCKYYLCTLSTRPRVHIVWRLGHTQRQEYDWHGKYGDAVVRRLLP